jgi:hypothetical protein
MGALRDLRIMAGDLLAGRYPSFVYGRDLRPGEAPPVLCLHTAHPATFPAMCEHLAAGGHLTLTAQEYVDRVAGRTPIGPRDLLLTFDDGHLSVWSIALPLLRKHGMKAVTFLIPGRMADDGPSSQLIRPTLDDVEAGGATMAQITEPLRDGYVLASWAEVRLMHDSGVIDCQAHTLHHRLVVASDRVVGFVTPSLRATAHPFELAMLAPPPGEAPAADVVMPPLGTPIYASVSRMSDTPAAFPDPAAGAACVELVEKGGGEAFFNSAGWEQRLRDTAANAATTPPRREREPEHAEAIAFDLRECRRRIEARLPGHAATHLAYPWGVGGVRSTQAAADAGYQGVHWGRVDGRVRNHVGDDPLKLARIGDDFFWTLPGPRRRPLRGVLWNKLASRWRRGSPYVSH